jgi:fatty-acyl-CoA synthase
MSFAQRARVAARVARSAGLVWSTSAQGALELVRIHRAGAQNPSQIYQLHAKNHPHKAALIHGQRRVSFADLDARVDTLVASLRALGLARGSSMLLAMHNSIELVELGIAASRMGVAAVTVSYRSTADELAFLAEHSGARLVVCDADAVPRMVQALTRTRPDLLSLVFSTGDAPPAGARPLFALYQGPRAPKSSRAEAANDDAAVVIYTSGTTGKPKGAVRKFPKSALGAVFNLIDQTPLRASDVHLVACPLYHSTAFGFLTISHILGNTVVLMDDFKPEAYLALDQKHHVTTSAVVPTMLHRVLSLPSEVRAQFDTGSLRVVFSGGAPLPAPVALAFMDTFGDVLFNFYGATETGFVTLANPQDLRAAPGTIGRPIPGNSIRLLGDDGSVLPVGEVGELFVKNDMMVAGYHNDASATAASQREGYFSVGDLARVDAAGRYFIEGRKRDMIISGGVNVYPAEVEGVLEEHPHVVEVAVVGVSDPEWGERVTAFVVLREPEALDELRRFAKERLAGPKQPRQYVVMTALPRNATGKVLKRDLRAASPTA